MTILAVPRFSPPPSESDDRATSPALSSSSRTTTSIPTDVSDISSLDGDDYEVIDGPVHMHEEIDGSEALEHTNASSLYRSQHDTSIASEIDGSSFLVPFPYERDNEEHHDEDIWLGEGHAPSLHASTSLATISFEPDADNMQNSSLLRFPDPLDESFQEDRSSLRQSSIAVQCSHTMDERVEAHTQAAETITPRIKQVDGSFVQHEMPLYDHSPKGSSDDDQVPYPSPIGIPFNWNKKMILVNITRAIMGLLVVILSTGVLPIWPESNVASKDSVQVCNGQSTAWLNNLVGRKAICSSATIPSKALLIPTKNSSSVFLSMTSLMTRPTSKAVRPSSRSKGMIRQHNQECNALSVYMSEVHLTHRASLLAKFPECLENVDGATFCHDVKNASRRKGKAAKKSAQIITASAHKKWQDYVKEMNELLHSTTFTIVENVRHQSIMLRQRKAKDDPFGKAWKAWYDFTFYMQRLWSDWMRDYHEIVIKIWTILREESTNFKRDAEANYRTARGAMDRQYKDAIVAAQILQKTFARDVRIAKKKFAKGAKDAKKNLAEKAKEAQKSWVRGADILQQSLTKAWRKARKEASEYEAMQRFEKEMRAVKKHASKVMKEKKERIRMAAIHLKEEQIRKAVRKRMMEIQQLRAKHRELMAMVREQSKVQHRAGKLINKGKLAIYRKAIQSVQARHQVENILSKMTTSDGMKKKKKNPYKSKKGIKNSPKKTARGSRGRA